MMHYLSKAKDQAIKGTALLRLDFNTEDDWRMRAVLPTVKLLIRKSDKIVIVSHRGRPTPSETPSAADLKSFSLKKDAVALSKMIGKKVTFVPHLDFGCVREDIVAAPKGSVFLLENLRFNAGEEKNDAKFAKQLASLGDFYVNDAFAVSHRANASVAAVTKFLPSYAGLELEKEIAFLSAAIRKPKHPLVLVIGGAKAGDKLGVVEHFKKKADYFLLGGGPEDTILSLRGMDIKKSIADHDSADIKKLKSLIHFKKLIVPTDYVWRGDMILDVGPKSAKLFASIIAKAKTIIWSGPLGFIEKKADSKGSLIVARAIVKNKKAFSVTGGGETVMFLKKYKLDRGFTFVSTGGGALLDFLAGEKLPGIEALK